MLSKEGEKIKKQIQKQAMEQMKDQDWDYEYTKENYIYQDSHIYMNRLGRDDNNIYKLLNDSLEKIIYDNDSRVLTRTQRILIDPKKPRVYVELHPVPFIGIFNNQNELNSFIESSCNKCNRYKRNCSILNKAIEGRVQDEIIKKENTYTCSKFKVIKQAKTSYSDNEVV